MDIRPSKQRHLRMQVGRYILSVSCLVAMTLIIYPLAMVITLPLTMRIKSISQ